MGRSRLARRRAAPQSEGRLILELYGVPAGSRTQMATTIELPVEGQLPSLEARQGGSGSGAADNAVPARKAGARRVLDVHLHQLDPDSPVGRSWFEKYRSDGLVVIGVHTPEFRSSDRSSTFAARRRRWVSSIRSRWTVTTRSGARLATDTGRRFTSRTRTDRSAITGSARASMSTPRASSSFCSSGRSRRGQPGPRLGRCPGCRGSGGLARAAIGRDHVGYDRAENFASPGGASREQPRSTHRRRSWPSTTGR